MFGFVKLLINIYLIFSLQELPYILLVFCAVNIGPTFAVPPPPSPSDNWQTFLPSKYFYPVVSHQYQTNPDFEAKRNYKYVAPSYESYGIYLQNYGNPFRSFGVLKGKLQNNPIWLTKTFYNHQKLMDNERKGSFILPNGEPYPIHRTIPGESWIKSYNRKFEDETDVIHRKRFTNQVRFTTSLRFTIKVRVKCNVFHKSFI